MKNQSKKLNIKKVKNSVDRLSQPKGNVKRRRDPDEAELKSILNKYDTKEVRIGGGGVKKFEYINPVPLNKSPVISKKNVKFASEYNRDLIEEEEVEGERYQLSKINEEEAGLREERKILDTLLSNKSQLETNKVSEHFTMMDNAMNEILGEQEDQTLIEVRNNETKHENVPTQEIKEQIEQKTVEVKDDIESINNNLDIPVRDEAVRVSYDSLNDRTTFNKDLDIEDVQSDFN